MLAVPPSTENRDAKEENAPLDIILFESISDNTQRSLPNEKSPRQMFPIINRKIQKPPQINTFRGLNLISHGINSPSSPNAFVLAHNKIVFSNIFNDNEESKSPLPRSHPNDLFQDQKKDHEINKSEANGANHYETNEDKQIINTKIHNDIPTKEIEVIENIPVVRDLNRQSFVKKHTLANPPSLVMDFILKTDQQKWFKFKILAVKFLLPHIVATIFSVGMISLHIKINSLCWLKEKCECNNDFLIKLYTLIRTFFDYWNLIALLGYYSIFIVKEIKNYKAMKYIMIGVFYAVIITMYLSSDGTDDDTASLLSYGAGFFIAFSALITIFCKLKFNFTIFKEKTLYQTLLLLILFSHLLAKRYMFNLVKTTLHRDLGDLGKNISQIVISIYSFIYKIVFKYLILKFSLRILKENGEYNAIIFFMRLIVCFIICINTSNIYEMEISDWGGWILVVTYCIFLFEFYTRINPYYKLYQWVKSLIYKTPMISSQANFDYEKILSLKKVLSGYLLDFQFIFIPRLLILYYYGYLIDFHSGDFSMNCALHLSNNFPNNPIMLYIIILINLLMPVIFFVWMATKKEVLFEFRFENYGFVQRTYVIFLFHTYFEFIFQDFLTSL